MLLSSVSRSTVFKTILLFGLESKHFVGTRLIDLRRKEGTLPTLRHQKEKRKGASQRSYCWDCYNQTTNSQRMLLSVFSCVGLAAALCQQRLLRQPLEEEDSAGPPASCPTAEGTGHLSLALIPAHCRHKGHRRNRAEQRRWLHFRSGGLDSDIQWWHGMVPWVSVRTFRGRAARAGWRSRWRRRWSAPPVWRRRQTRLPSSRCTMSPARRRRRSRRCPEKVRIIHQNDNGAS